MVAALVVCFAVAAAPAAAARSQLLDDALFSVAVVGLDGGGATVAAGTSEALELHRAGGLDTPFAPVAQVRSFADAAFAADGSGAVLRDYGRGVRLTPFDPRGALAPGVPLSRTGHDDVAEDLAVAPNGTVLALWWERRPRRQPRLLAAVRGAGVEAFEPPEVLFVAPEVTDARGEIGNGGDAVVAVGADGCGQPAVVALRRPRRGFGVARTLHDGSSCAHALAVGPDGTIVVAHDISRRGGVLVRSAARGARRLGPARALGRRLLSPPSIVVARSGRTLLAATRGFGGPDGEHRVEVWEGGPGKPLRRTAVFDDGYLVAADLADDGSAVIAWTQQAHRAGYAEAFAARRSGGRARFGRPERLHDRPFPSMEVVDADLAPDGGAVVAWDASTRARAPGRFSGVGVTRLAAPERP